MVAERYILLVLALGLAATGSVLLYLASRRRDLETVDERIDEFVAAPRSLPRRGVLTRFLMRAGFSGRISGLYVALAVLLLVGLAGVYIAGARGGVVSLLIALAAAYLVVYWRGQRRLRAMEAQLPGFVEHIIRSLQAGRTLSVAVAAATREMRPPVAEVMQRVQREVDMGASLSDALQGAADIYRVDALQLVAIGVRINLRYGGSAIQLMEQVVTLLRQRERARRELKAMTGETRISAGVLAILPVGVGGYTVMMNPDYYATMLESTVGVWLLGGAMAWQVLGIFLIWRMVKSL
ncbi:type II secretion system F family protein [Alkalilimnicola ehrlichii MLHE-1]|uniref:Type II secretion system protein n=1 Tax=Alkalilimnicola ehrlichii (strain ATCC BAA-1101 / DSM 17681 / MLHE-1) TaxID=187272 RepID=Q0A6N6_ALKEH|nr:type II secretion system F family protein [Alkalilimnicola ehrlichii]ABI57501.1 type II secretion system protein [Alkalilimnicola ehrlichii MLHE-1]